MHLYGLILGIAFLIGSEYFLRQKIVLKKLENIFIFGLIISAIVGARVYHVIDQWNYYSQHLSQIPATWNGGLGIFGGIVSALIFIYFFSLIYQFSFIVLLNAISPILPLCQAIGRFGNWVNHENPIWWPEAILDFFLFLIIFKFPQNPTAKYLIGYGLIRFTTEFWRHDTWIISQIKIGQILSILFIIIGIYLYAHRVQKK